MTKSKLHLILINDNQLHKNTIDVLQEHFTPDLGINIGFIESFDYSRTNDQKLKKATQECFALLTETKMWAFVPELVEPCGVKENLGQSKVFGNFKNILLDVLFENKTTMLIHGSQADTSFAMSILTDSDIAAQYKLELTIYKTIYDSNNAATYHKINTTKVRQKLALSTL